MTKLTQILLAYALIFWPAFTFSQSGAALPEEVRESIDRRIENGINPAISVGIIDKDGPVFFNYGKTKTDGTPVDEHTIYEIGSISKVFTGILLADMVIKGIVNLDDPVGQYLPAEVTVPNDGKNEITFGNLSDHTSSLPRLPSNLSPVDPNNPYADYTVEQMYSFISGYKLTRDIGSQYEYSNLAQGFLGHILSLIAEMPYESLMIKTIAIPLGMDETKIELDQNMKDHLATGHNNGREAENWDIPTLAGAGAIRSSTYDMLKFLSANLGYTQSNLRQAMDLSYQARHNKANGMRVGLAWHIRNGQEGDIIWHNGGTGGYRAFAGFVKNSGKGVVLLTNSTASVDDIGFHLLDPNSNLQNIRASIGTEIGGIIDSEGIEAAMKRFRELNETSRNDYDFSEGAINRLGYSYLESNLDAALAIFKMNVELYPNSYNVYDSYGEALLKNGQTELAIENYKRSVEIYPGNANGIDVLNKLGITAGPENIEISQEVLETYVGTYQISALFGITITKEGTRLFAQATGQSSFEIFPKSDTVFYYKVVQAEITFNKENEEVKSLTLFQNGQNIRGEKVK